MKLVNKLILALVFLTSINTAQAANDKKLTYVNQRGSTMTLVFHQLDGNTGTLAGTFTTAVGEHAKDVGVPQTLSGFYNGNAITVAFNFPHSGAAAAMTGNLLDGGNKIQTLWLVASDSKDPTHTNWNSNIVGTDAFNLVTK